MLHLYLGVSYALRVAQMRATVISVCPPSELRIRPWIVVWLGVCLTLFMDDTPRRSSTFTPIPLDVYGHMMDTP